MTYNAGNPAFACCLELETLRLEAIKLRGKLEVSGVALGKLVAAWHRQNHGSVIPLTECSAPMCIEYGKLAEALK